MEDGLWFTSRALRYEQLAMNTKIFLANCYRMPPENMANKAHTFTRVPRLFGIHLKSYIVLRRMAHCPLQWSSCHRSSIARNGLRTFMALRSLNVAETAIPRHLSRFPKPSKRPPNHNNSPQVQRLLPLTFQPSFTAGMLARESPKTAPDMAPVSRSTRTTTDRKIASTLDAPATSQRFERIRMAARKRRILEATRATRRTLLLSSGY